MFVCAAFLEPTSELGWPSDRIAGTVPRPGATTSFVGPAIMCGMARGELRPWRRAVGIFGGRCVSDGSQCSMSCTRVLKIIAHNTCWDKRERALSSGVEGACIVKDHKLTVYTQG